LRYPAQVLLQIGVAALRWARECSERIPRSTSSKILGLARVWAGVVALAGFIGCGSDEEPGDGGGATERTADSDWVGAPPPFAGADFLAVPIDVLAVNATLLFDLSNSSARAMATMRFRMGSQQGHPIFDLRQNIEDAALDGSAISPADVPAVDLGGGPGAEMRVLHRELAAGSEHVLELSYVLSRPLGNSFDLAPPRFDASGVHWNFNLADYDAGHFLEQWLPANLIHDRFPVALELELVGGAAPHTLLANGSVEETAPNRFHATFPGHYVAHSHFLVLEPAAQLRGSTTPLALVDGSALELRVYTAQADVDLDSVPGMAERALNEHVSAFGAFPESHGLTLFVWSGNGMEYNGAATIFVFGTPVDGKLRPGEGVIRHETLHSWFGRGLSPLTQSDGWWDEAWVTYVVDYEGNAMPFAADDAPLKLRDDNPYNRAMRSAEKPDPYENGPRVFANLAARLGAGQLRELMAELYQVRPVSRVSTDDLERFLFCKTRDHEVRRIFQRFVHGKATEVEPPLEGACD
jgi:hypothetical protein